jgi:hypothetical protein
MRFPVQHILCSVNNIGKQHLRLKTDKYPFFTGFLQQDQQI